MMVNFPETHGKSEIIFKALEAPKIEKYQILEGGKLRYLYSSRK